MAFPAPDFAPPADNSGGLLARAGQQLANAPSDILNDLLRLQYNVGAVEDNQSAPYQVAKPYEIGEAKTLGEGAVDVGASLVKSLPLFLGGETAGAGVAELTGAGKILSGMMRVGGGFATQGLSESPEQAAVGGVMGAGMGAAQELPLRARIPLAAGIGVATGAEAYHHGASATSSVIQGAANALLSMMGRRRIDEVDAGTTEPPVATLQLPAANRLALEDVQSAQTIPGTGGPMPFGGVLDESTTRARPIFGTEQASSRPIYATDTPSTFDAETGLQLTNPPDLLALPKRSVPPPGSLIREPSVTADELDRFLNRRSAPPAPATEAGPNRIVGPALVDNDGRVLIKGDLTENHESLMRRGMAEQPENVDKIVDAMADDERHVFVDAKGNILSREAAAQVAREAGQVGNDITSLHSQALRDASQGGEGGTSKVATLQPGNDAFAHQIAKEHGVEYHGVVPMTTIHEFKFPDDAPHAAYGANFNLESGATSKDLGDKIRSKIAEFEDGKPKPPAGSLIRDASVTEGELRRAGKFPSPPPGSLIRDARYTEGELRAAGKIPPEPKPVATSQPAAPAPAPAARADLLRKLWNKKAASESGPSSLETGSPVKFKDADGTVIKGRIESIDDGVVNIRDIDGDIHNVYQKDVRGLDEPFNRNEEDFQGIGSAEDVASAAEDDTDSHFKLGGGGTMRRSNFGEQGAVGRDFAQFMGRYGTATIGGALGGAVWDHDHPIRGAILGAVAGGMIARYGWRAYDMFLEAHPDIRAAAGISEIPVKLGKAIGKDTLNAARASFADDYMAGRAAQNFRDDVGINRIARFMQQNFTMSDLMRRMTTQAVADVDILADELHMAARQIAKHPDLDIPANSNAFLKFMQGSIDVATLQQSITDPQLRNAIFAAKNQLDSLESILARGLGDTALGKTIRGNIGKYMTRAYRVFHDSKYAPTDAQIEAAANSMRDIIGGGSDEQNVQILNDYLHEIKSSQGMYRGGATSMAQRLDTVLARPEKLTPEFREMLGEYENPLQRLAATALKVTRSARVASLYNAMADEVNPATGLKYVLTGEELATERARLESISQYATGVAKDKADATLQLLKNMTYIPREAALGRLSGMWAPLEFRDHLATWDSLNRTFTSPAGRFFAQITNQIKKGKTVYSPFQFTRQVLNFPLLALMAKAGPTHMARAVDVVFNQKKFGSEILKLKELGIWGGDIVHGMFNEDMARLMKEQSLDSYLYSSPVKDFQNWWEEKYRTPDLAVRVAAYYKGVELGQRAGLAGRELENYAVDHTNRYTVNYQAVPPGLQKARQFPFVNQYLTFLWEVSRITKNLAQDALVRRDPHAMGILGTLAISPFILQHLSESTLSDEDRKDWEQAKALGPEYQRSNFKFVHGRNADGSFSYTDFTPLLVHDTWLKTARAFFHGDWSALAADNPFIGWENTPLLNVAINQATGTDRHSGIKFEGLSDRLDSMRKDIGPTLIGTELDNFVKATTPNADGTMGLTNTRSGASTSLWGMLKSYVSATRDYNVKLDYLKQRQVSSTHELILNERAKLMQTMRTNAASDVKQTAINAYQSRVRDAVATLQQNINPPDSMASLSSTQSSQ